jgi:hypothetical protein
MFRKENVGKDFGLSTKWFLIDFGNEIVTLGQFPSNQIPALSTPLLANIRTRA